MSEMMTSWSSEHYDDHMDDDMLDLFDHCPETCPFHGYTIPMERTNRKTEVQR